MKKWNFLIAFCLSLLSINALDATSKFKAPLSVSAIAKSADFAGRWQGNEQCQAVSAPIAVVIITADGPEQVFLSGVYSMQGKIRGVVKGNTINIPRQAVVDPSFKNMEIEGNLTMGASHKTLTGVFTVLNNNLRDGCTVNYSR